MNKNKVKYKSVLFLFHEKFSKNKITKTKINAAGPHKNLQKCKWHTEYPCHFKALFNSYMQNSHSDMCKAYRIWNSIFY